jgi:nitrate reductase delta subunit
MTIAAYKILSLLLSYPSEDLRGAFDDLAEEIRSCLLFSAGRRADLATLVVSMASEDALDLQEEYVEIFDRSRSLSLHLFEHIHGESRDRGQAMVSLRERYQASGLDLASNELPDYLPLFLEFLSQQPPVEAQLMLGEISHLLQVLAERHTRRGSRYAILFEALRELADTKPDAAALAELRQTIEDNPADLAALDRAWEEAEIRFGPGDAGAQSCSRASQMLDRMSSLDGAAGGKA